MKKILALTALIPVLFLVSCKTQNVIEGRVLENKSIITRQGMEYRAKIALTDKLGHEQWVWVTIPERDAKVLPLGSWLIVDLNSDGYRVVNY